MSVYIYIYICVCVRIDCLFLGVVQFNKLSKLISDYFHRHEDLAITYPYATNDEDGLNQFLNDLRIECPKSRTKMLG